MANIERRHRAETPASPFQDIPIELIDVGPQQLRHTPHDDDIVELAADIATHGMLQPIGVRPTTTGRYQLLWGSRRLTAHKRLRRPTIHAKIDTNTEHDVKVLAAVENLQRVQLTIAEECDAVCSLHDAGRSPDQICALLSKSRAWVNRRLAIPNLPLELRTPTLDGRLSVGCAEQIARLADPGARSWVIQQVETCHLNIDQTRATVDAIEAQTRTGNQQATTQPETPQVAPTILLTPCVACGRPRLIQDLMLIKVCATGCTTDAPGAPTTDDQHPTRQ